MSWFVLGAILLLLGLFAMHRLANASPQSVISTGKWIFVGGVGIVLLMMLARGQLQMIWLAALAALPWIGRFLHLKRLWKTLQGPTAGQYSEVKSRYLHMRLNQTTGEMDGYVLEGFFKDRYLNQMDLSECLELLDEVAEDSQSCQLLSTYIDKVHGDEWRRQQQEYQSQQKQSNGSSASNGQMSREEALEVLGLSEGASEEEIRSAHRRLMKNAHPDHGGSDYLAAKINQAKDVLLGQ